MNGKHDKSARAPLAVLIVIAIMASLVAAPTRAAAASVTYWTAQSTFSEGFGTADDAVADTPRAMDQNWGRSVHLSDPSAAWPVGIQVDTPLLPSTLTPLPNVTPTTTGARSLYSWSTTTGSFIGFYSNVRPMQSPGFSVTRELSGGRAVAAGSTLRHFTVTIAASHAMNYSVEIQFIPRFAGTPPVLPVDASNVSCTPSPDMFSEALRPRWGSGSARGGETVRIECDVSVTSSSAGAIYMPSVMVSEVSSSFVVLPEFQTTATNDDPLLGRTTFAVTPPIDAPQQGQASSFRTRYVYMDSQNEIQRGTPWYAQYTRSLSDNTYEPGDVLTNAPRTFTPYSFMYLQTPGWPGSIEVKTPLAPGILDPYPVVTPTTSAGGETTYTWDTTETFFNATLRDTRPVTRAPGITMTRELVGGRDLAPHQVATREFRLDIHVVETASSLYASGFFESPFTPGAVVASNLSCPGGTIYPWNPGFVFWWGLPATAGSDIHQVCTVTLENTSDYAARYMPQISASAGWASSLPSVPGSTVELTDPGFGSIRYRVTPPAGEGAEGNVFQSESLNVNLAGENSSNQPAPWSALFTDVYQYGTSDNVVPDVTRPFERSWEFALQRPNTWPGSISTSTALDTTGWFVYPPVTPTSSDGLTTYRWDGPDLFGFLSSLGTGMRITNPTSLGVAVTREAIGGTRIAAGATARRSFVFTLVGTTNVTAAVSVFFATGAAGTPFPVTVRDTVCTPSSTFGGGESYFWSGLALPQGVAVRLECSATITNTAAVPAHYMPILAVDRSTTDSVVGPEIGRTRYSFDAPPLGTVTFEVTPPPGATAAGSLTKTSRRSVFLGPTNRALAETRLTYVGDTSAFSGESAVLAAKLEFLPANAPLANVSLSFQVNGATYTATTGADGIARVTVGAVVLGGAGPKTVTVTFAEDTFFLGSSLTTTVNILRRPTTLSYTGNTSATFGFAQLAAQLNDTRSAAAVGGKTISFAIDGVAVGTAATDATGRAVLTSPPASRLGPGEHTIGLSFPDDTTHAASTATGRIAISNSVGKVSGDLRTTNGARVTFNVKSDASVTGALDLTTATRSVSVRNWIGFGISADRKNAVLYGRTASGEDVVAELTDAGDPGRNDRAIVRINGSSLTGDGAVTEGNVQIHK